MLCTATISSAGAGLQLQAAKQQRLRAAAAPPATRGRQHHLDHALPRSSSVRAAANPLLPGSGTRAAANPLLRGSRHTRCAASSTDSPAPATNPWAKPGYGVSFVSSLPDEQQQLWFVGILAAIAAGTAVNAAVLGPAVSAYLPGWLQVTGSSWFPLGPIFIAAGVAHFTEEQGFKSMYPHTGAWGGLWQLPGSPSFHVQWTGVAEILGGLGLCLGCLPFDAVPAWLAPASAMGLFWLTAVVTPANIYMFTHGAPGPIPESVATEPIPWQGHLARGLMQVLLLSTLWGIATASS